MKRTQRGLHATYARSTKRPDFYSRLLHTGITRKGVWRDRKGRKVRLRFMDTRSRSGIYEASWDDRPSVSPIPNEFAQHMADFINSVGDVNLYVDLTKPTEAQP